MRYQKGARLALVTALISGIAIFFNGLAVKAAGDGLIFTTVKNLGVGLLIGLWLGVRGAEWKKIGKKDWGRLILIAVIGGGLAFYLFFQGLMLAESAKAALLHKSLIFWIGLWAVPVLKEKISLKQWIGLGFIFGSNLIIGGIGEWSWGVGEWMILGATILWAAENVMAKVVLKKVEADVVAGIRMIFGSGLLMLGAGMSGKLGLITRLNGEQWGLMLISMGLLFGYVMSWYRALRIAPVTLAATVLSLGAVISNILSAIFITHRLPIGLIYQTILLLAGVGIFSREVRKNARNVKVRQVCV